MVLLEIVEKLQATIEHRDADFKQVLQQKDKLLQEKDKDIKQLQQQKDEDIKQLQQQKDNDIKQLHEEKDLMVQNWLRALSLKDDYLHEQINKKEQALLQAENLQQALAVSRTEVLGLRGKRNLRGALEFVANNVLAGGKGGTQKGLNKLKADNGFRAKLQYICKQHNLREEDVLKCLENLYHTFSKEMHGVDADSVRIPFAHVTSPAERAALAAVFESQQIEYVCVDEQGDELQPSPYH